MIEVAIFGFARPRVPRNWKPRIRRVTPEDGQYGWEVRPMVSRHFGKMYWCEGLADAFRYAHEMYDATRERFRRQA